MKISKKITIVIFSLLLSLVFCFGSRCLAAGKTVGVIFTGDVPYIEDMHAAFLSRLAKDGYAGKVEVITQKPYPDPMSLTNSVRKLIAMDVDLIVAYGSPAFLAAVNEKTRVPIVYGGVYEPYTQKLRGKNITGIGSKVSVSSLLRYLRNMTDIRSLGVCFSDREGDSVYQMKEILSLSSQYGITVEQLNISRPQEARQVLSGKRPDALFMTSSSIVQMALPEFIGFADGLKIPSVALAPDKSGSAVISLFADPTEQGAKAAEKVIKVLDGVSPERISTETSHNVELVFNLRKAKLMGWKIPMELVASATRLIK